MIKEEFKSIWKNKILLVSVLAIMTIPFLYSVFFLKSVWDPYGSIGHLPVAVVNEDRPVEFHGKKVDVGNQFVKKLKKNHELQWHFVSKDNAEYGLHHKKYYMVLTIPKNFSKNSTTILDPNPKKMEITYKTNDSLNYIGKVISEQGAKEVNNVIRNKVSDTYAQTAFQLMKQLGGKVQKGVKGAKQLADGSKALSNGINVYTAGVEKLSNGVILLQSKVAPMGSGVQQLSDGSHQLVHGLHQYTGGVTMLANGVGLLNSNTGALSNGVNKLADGGHQLANGLGQYTNGVSQLAGGIGLLHSKTGMLMSGVSQLANGSSQLTNGLGQYTGGVNQLANGLNLLNSKTSALGDGVNKLAAGGSQLANGLGQYTGGVSQLAGGIGLLNSKSGALEQGVGALSAGATKAKDGVTAYTNGADQLNNGIVKLYNSVANPQISSSLSQLDKMKQLPQAAAGLYVMNSTLNAGLTQMANELNKANAQIQGQVGDGAKQLQAAQQAIGTIDKTLQPVLGQVQNLPKLLSSAQEGQAAYQQQVAGALTAIGGNAQASAAAAGDAAKEAAALAATKDLPDTVKAGLAKIAADSQTVIAKSQDTGKQLGSVKSASAALQAKLAPSQKALEGLNSQMANIIPQIQKVEALRQQAEKMLPGLEKQASSSVTQFKELTQAVNKLQAVAAKSAAVASQFNQSVNSDSSQLTAGDIAGIASSSNPAAAMQGQAGKLAANSSLPGMITKAQAALPQLITGITKLKDGSAKLVSNNAALTGGLTQLAGGMDKLQGNVPALVQGIAQLNQGAQKLQTNSGKLTDGVSQLTGGLNQLSSNVPALIQGVNKLDSGAQLLQSNSGKLMNGANLLNNGLGRLNANVPALANGVDRLNNGAQLLQSNSGKLMNGANQLSGGLDQLNNKVPTLVQGIARLNAGAQMLQNNSAKLNNGAVQLSGGIDKLNANVPLLVNGVNKLAEGGQKLNTASAKLEDGAHRIKDGNKLLATKLAQGADKMKDLHLTDKTADMMSNPTKLKHETYSEVPNYGYALAPYMLSVALYVGALVFNFIYPIRRLASPDGSATSWFLSKVAVGVAASLGTALVETLLMMACGLHPEHPVMFILNAISFALTSMFTVMFLSLTFENPGRFLSMVFLVIQLGACGGSFPIQITRAMHGFFEAINPYIPMTYSVYGFRQSLNSGFGMGQMYQSFAVQILYIALWLVLLWISMSILRSSGKISFIESEADIKYIDDNSSESI